MSLLGRLEDLSLTDIVQIVFLSRRTGVLEIIDDVGRHTVLFRQGLIANASAPDNPDLVSYLEATGAVSKQAGTLLRQMEESGIPYGTAVLEMNLMTTETLSDAIHARILAVVTPLLQSREGEFNFILSDQVRPLDVEYDPDVLFKEGGFPPSKILGVADGEKIKPLNGLEGAPPPPAREARAEQPAGVAPAARGGQFKVSGGLIEVHSPDATYRNVVLFERNPLIRVAARRAFSKNGVKIAQFGAIDDVRHAIGDLFRANSFFVTFLELTVADHGENGPSVVLMQRLKRRNPRLPVVVIDNEADLRRRHDLLRAGADLYLTKPTPARLQPGLAEEELSLFADELVLFAERAFHQWEQLTGGFDSDAGRRFYDQAQKETLDRSFSMLKQLINELSNPNDIGEVSSTILRLSAEYLDRGALFVAAEGAFEWVGGFGTADMSSRVRALKIGRTLPSILADVATEGRAHRGKMRRTAANVELIEKLGGELPTEVVALPIMHANRTIGILYGDNAEHRAPIDSMTGLEIFLSQAGYAFSNAVFAAGKK